MTVRMRLFWSLVVTAGLLNCRAEGDKAREDPMVLANKVERALPSKPVDAVLVERTGQGRIHYLGTRAEPDRVQRGQSVQLTHYFRVEDPATGSAQVFVHGEVPGSGERVLVADHAPILGRLPIPMWQKGEIWADTHKVHIPERVQGDRVRILLGFYEGKTRWTVEARAGVNDGKNRIVALDIGLSGEPPKDDLPQVVIPRATGPITADGVLDEAAWASAPVLDFHDTMGRPTKTRYPTKLRLLYDDKNLYVGFDSTDVDITERYKNRDDPIYDHETVELFIMPNVVAPETGPYIELQASPGGVIFDASFNGPRQGMNKAYNAGQTIGTKLDGTLNTQDKDRGWVSEWVVPFRNMRGVKAAPKDGTEWRMNAYRIEKFRESGKTQGEFTAWSPPRVGDFHHVPRFGRMKFGK